MDDLRNESLKANGPERLDRRSLLGKGLKKKVWCITGAGRGLGLDIAKSALAAGHAVVATGRDPGKVIAAIGAHDDLLAVKLDVTRPEDARTAVEEAVAKFGRIDVLVNNAGNFFAGFFEELSEEQVRHQIDTLLFGPMNVTRAVLPVMRQHRSGLLMTISSTAGISGGMFCTAYAAAKFGVEGWMESIAPEIAPFGIRTMLVEPGFFRTDLLTTDSTTYADPSIDDYAERTRETVAAWSSMNGKQSGIPPNSPPRSCNLPNSWSPQRVLLQVRMLYRSLRLKPRPCSPKPMLTETCPRLSPMMKPEQIRRQFPE
jgi:NAD(P)-dependent dehydrogenase (short-subunit alcohol dehydrogenase family)